MAFLRKAFERFDTDGSGTINKTELQKACASLGKAFSDRQIKQIMDQADTDNSGELEYDEFVASIEGELRTDKWAIVTCVDTRNAYYTHLVKSSLNFIT